MTELKPCYRRCRSTKTAMFVSRQHRDVYLSVLRSSSRSLTMLILQLWLSTPLVSVNNVKTVKLFGIHSTLERASPWNISHSRFPKQYRSSPTANNVANKCWLIPVLPLLGFVPRSWVFNSTLSFSEDLEFFLVYWNPFFKWFQQQSGKKRAN